MQKHVICVLLILLLSGISAQNITLDYPSEVEANQEFLLSVLLSDFDSDTYDIKIDFLDSEGTRVAKVLNNGEWKSTYYYINNAISNGEEKEFQLTIENYAGVSSITVKIRVSGTSTIVGTFEGYTIESLPAQIPEEQTEQQNKGTSSGEQVENDETSQEESKEKEENKEVIATKIIENYSYEERTINLTPIRLNSSKPSNAKNIKSENNKENLERNLAFSGVIAFCVAFGVLFLLRLGKNKNEFK